MKYLFLLVPGLIFPIILQYFEHQKKRKYAIIFKSLSSLTFVLLGILCAKHCSLPRFALFVVIAQVCGAIGDIVLTVRHSISRKSLFFYVGGSFFYIGHLFFIVAFASRAGDYNLLKYIIAALLVDFIVVLVIERIIRSYSHTGYRILCGIYLATICTAVVFSFGTFFSSPFSFGNLLFMFGATLFLSSDMILITNEQNPRRKAAMSDLLIGLYYSGQLLIALSLQFI